MIVKNPLLEKGLCCYIAELIRKAVMQSREASASDFDGFMHRPGTMVKR